MTSVIVVDDDRDTVEVFCEYLSIKDIQAIRNSVVRIAANHGLTSQEALGKLQKDITGNYDKILGLEPELKSLTRRKERLEKEIKEQKEDLEDEKQKTAARVNALKEDYNKVKEQIDAYLELRRKGITDKELKRWASIITISKLNPTVIEEELKSQRNLKRLEDETNERITGLEHKEKELKAGVDELISKRNKIEKSIEAVQQAGINRIQSVTDSTSKQAEHTLNIMTQTITEISNQTKNILESSKQTTQQIIDNTEKSTKETKKNLNRISNQVISIIDEAIKAGERVGSLRPIADAYQFLDRGIGEPNVVLPLSRRFLTNLKIWLKKMNKRDTLIDSKIDDIIDHLEI